MQVCPTGAHLAPPRLLPSYQGWHHQVNGNDTGEQSEKEIWDFTVSTTAVDICVVGKFVNGGYGGKGEGKYRSHGCGRHAFALAVAGAQLKPQPRSCH
jgi:hypothetical protein